jgi:hypothetical protein
LAAREAEQVGGDAHLAVTALASPNADHRDGQPLLQFPGQFAGDVFEHHRKATDLLEGQGLALEGVLAGSGVALASVAQLVDGLGG